MVDMAEEPVQPKQRKAISAAKRARLEEIFKRAGKIGQEKLTGAICRNGPGGAAHNVSQSPVSDFDFAADLLAQCVIGDPGNPAYDYACFCGAEVGVRSVETCTVAVVGVDCCRGGHVGHGVGTSRTAETVR